MPKSKRAQKGMFKLVPRVGAIALLFLYCNMSSELRRALTVKARCPAVPPCRIQPALNTLTL